MHLENMPANPTLSAIYSDRKQNRGEKRDVKLPRFLGKSQKERPFLPHFVLQFGLASASASEDHSSCVAVKAHSTDLD